MKLFIALAASLTLSACSLFSGGGPQADFVSAQRVYNAAMSELVRARTPCVTTPANPEFGPDHPQCLISDSFYNQVEAIRKTADQCLRDADLALINNDPDAVVYIECAEGAAAAIIGTLASPG